MGDPEYAATRGIDLDEGNPAEALPNQRMRRPATLSQRMKMDDFMFGAGSLAPAPVTLWARLGS